MRIDLASVYLSSWYSEDWSFCRHLLDVAVAKFFCGYSTRGFQDWDLGSRGRRTCHNDCSVLSIVDISIHLTIETAFNPEVLHSDVQATWSLHFLVSSTFLKRPLQNTLSLTFSLTIPITRRVEANWPTNSLAGNQSNYLKASGPDAVWVKNGYDLKGKKEIGPCRQRNTV